MWLFRPTLLLLLSATLLAQSNPVPLINNPLVPMSAVPGGGGFTLTVNGTGFVAGSVVNWNRVALQTTFVSSSRLTATVPAANIAAAGVASVTVVNPAPGGGTSNVDFFDIRQPFTALSFGYSTVDTGYQSDTGTTTDLNNDGKLDFVAVDSASGVIVSFLGHGDGTFQLIGEYPAAIFPYFVAAGDYNGDGNPDLAVTGGNYVFAILLGNGDGTFQPEQDITLPNYGVFSVLAGDFNGDGKLDIAMGVGGGSNILVLLGNGDGSFQDVTSYTVGNGVEYGLTTGDFNGDGKLDLAVNAAFDSAIAVAMGNGDGTFQSAVEYPTPIGPESVVAADFNGDGRLDLAAACTAFDRQHGAFSILLGNGDGTFQGHLDNPTTPEDVSIATADMNGDGKLDVVVSYFYSPLVSTFLGNGDGTFQSQNDFFVPGELPVIGDFNGDGRLDMATAGGRVIALAETAVLSKTFVRFGKVKIGQNRSAKVRLSNTGSNAFIVNRLSIDGEDAAQYSQNNNCIGRYIAPGANCWIRITLKPTRPSAKNSAMVKISDTAAQPLQTIYLQGFTPFP